MRLTPERLAAAEPRKVNDPPPDLNDPAVLEALLNMAVLDATKILTGPAAGMEAMIDNLARETARILLGYERVTPRKGWNCPGGIDAHCNEALGLGITVGPMTRMREAVELMIEDLGIPPGVEGRTGKLPADWEARRERTVKKWHTIFSGLPYQA